MEKHVIDTTIEQINNETEDLNNQVYEDELVNVLTDDSIDFNVLCKILTKRYNSDLSHLSWDQQFSFLKDKALTIIPEENLLKKLIDSKSSWKPLVIKFWIDPTWANIHMWHAVPMIMLNRLQRMWHKISLVIWDFTAKIGDPTWRSKERPPLTDEKIQENLSTYKEQVSPFFDMEKASVSYNGDWLRNKTLDELIWILSKVKASNVLQRDDFRKRLENNQWLTMAELIYPIVMWMDSVNLKNWEWCDIELWGKDQLLNMQMCRNLMEVHWQEPETIISTDILEGISWWWLKMSKSLNNYIALNDSPNEIFGKVMSIPDSLLEIYYKSLTDITENERNILDKKMKDWWLNPMILKKSLAKIFISVIYDDNASKQAEIDFEKAFSKDKDYRNLDIEEVKIEKDSSVLSIINQIFGMSNSEVRRLVEWNWVSIILPDNTQIKINKIDILNAIWNIVKDKAIVKVWKRKFIKVNI